MFRILLKIKKIKKNDYYRYQSDSHVWISFGCISEIK